MLFNSIEFLIFFPLTTVLYFLLPQTWRWLLLLIASCVFYMFFVPAYILILAATIVVDYIAAIQIEKHRANLKKSKRWLVGSIISTCIILVVFKYFNFFLDNIQGVAHLFGWNYSVTLLNIVLPIGLSFHTFQSLSYVIEVYRGNQEPEKHFGIYSLYVMFYPQLVAGPIERPQNLLHQFHETKSFNYDDVAQGLQRMLWGLVKKVVIADNLSSFIAAVYDSSEVVAWYYIAVAMIMFSVQIYCDFSGYSDIALGAARVMGFRLMENFKFPYLSQSISEFWSRWHMSLSTWFRDYVYIPLGGNRKGVMRAALNTLAVFGISGLWHGANWTFVVWGVLHGAFVIFSNRMNIRFSNKLWKISATLFTFALVTWAWVFFRADSFGQAKNLFRGLFLFRGQTGFLPSSFIPFTPWVIAWKLFLLGLFLWLDYRVSSIIYYEVRLTYNRRWIWLSALLATLALMGNWGEVGFIYFQF